jgi:hypothetical protein
MQDEIVARLASALNVQFIVAEARRAAQAPTPDSVDLCFQALDWLAKGQAPEQLARAQNFFERALTADPDNIDALIGSALVDTIGGTTTAANLSVVR